ncbi:MAG: monomeric [FeFe] hydrogenase [Clostridia bacterium]|nr:monomeric [FeFe] hydrogenase [Clostridia bacterium]
MAKTKLFESNVDVIKYKVLREVARHAWDGEDPFRHFNEIADVVAPMNEPPQRCCIYKDRAVVAERIRLSLGEYRGSKDTIQVVQIACDDCPKSGRTITDMCRGCLAHNCREACPVDAIALDAKGRAHIDKTKCIECGRCQEACKYGAVANFTRPCERRCPVDAISMSENGASQIDQDKCIVCGNCVYECPFGAMNEVSGIERVINAIRSDRRVYAIIAPAVATQFPGTSVGQIFSATKELGFTDVVEVAEGADLTALQEANELLEKGFLTTSCCPAFVEYINVKFPMLKEHVSHTPSPMVLTAKTIKAKDPDAVIYFIGPCIAKKYERKKDIAKDYVDGVLTFLELKALFDSKGVDPSGMEEMKLNNSSPYARGFAQAGGVAQAVKQALIELGHEDFDLRPIAVSGPAEIKACLMKAKAGKLDYNLIEGMMCAGGCVRGNGTLINKKNTPATMNEYMEQAEKRTIK